MFIAEYNNAIQVSIYDQKPTLGSMTMGYPVGDTSQHMEIFTGNHNQFSNVLASMLSYKLKKIIYASVNLTMDTIVDLNIMKQFVDQFLEDRN